MSTARPTPEPADAGGRGLIDLDIPGAMRRRWWLVALLLVACWGLAYWYTQNATKLYESDSQLLVLRKNPAMSDGTSNSYGIDRGISDDTLATHLSHIKSRTVLEETLNRTGLGEDEQFLADVGTDGIPEDYLAERVEVARGGEGQARDAQTVRISYRDDDPERTRTVVEVLTKQYEDWLDENFKDENIQAVEMVSRELEDLKKSRDNAVNELISLRERFPTLSGDSTIQNPHIINYQQYEAKKAEVQALLAEKEYRLKIVEDGYKDQRERGTVSAMTLVSLISDEGMNRISKLLEIGDPIANSPDFLRAIAGMDTQARSEFTEKIATQIELAETKSRLGPNHPEVQSLEKKLETYDEAVKNLDARNRESASVVQSMLEELMNPEKILLSYIDSIKNDVRQLNGQFESLDQLAKSEEKAASDMVGAELKKEELELEVDRNNDLYIKFVERLDNLGNAQEFGGYIHNIQSRPRVGDEVWPNVPVCFAAATLLGLLLGGGGAVALEATDTSFRNSDQVQRTLGVPVLAQLKTVKRVKTAPDAPVSGELITHFDSTSVDSEAFRSLRTSLLFKAKDGNLRAIGVTSANQGDGKSLVLGNLAVTLAQTNKRVLLVDGDLRRPRVHKLFPDLDNARGLTEVLQGVADADELTQQSGVNNLTVLPAGLPPENPAELLQGDRFRQFVEAAEAEYDFVLIDLPPVLAVSDPCIAAHHLDGIVFVLKVAKIKGPEAQDVVETIKAAGGEVLGVVINGHEAGAKFNFGGRGGVGTYYSDYGGKKGYVNRTNGSNGSSGTARGPKKPPRNRVAAAGSNGARNGVRNGSPD